MSAFAVAAFHDALLALGTDHVDAVVWVRPAGVAEDGTDVSLRVWTPVGASVVVLREVAPAITDLLAGAVRIDERTVEFAAGRWTDGAREYDLGVALAPCADGERMLAARVQVVTGGEVAGSAAVAVTWSDAAAPATATGPTGPGAADLPTGRSPQPRHTGAAPGLAGERCPGCDEATALGDRYCEGCGRELDGG
ncbi:MAG TPA: hypothetical protein VGO80_08845 [Solirubrobacteraceae bacterium]|jgi:hypothetical protein|nr:hypothetical protein [Solirubrobacteraceae bacterium]